MTDVILTEVEDNSGMLAAINDNFDKLETAINLSLSKAVDAVNTLHTVFDANSQRLINLPAPVDGTDAARLVDITGTGTTVSLPSVTGQAGKFLGTDGTTALWTSFSTISIPTSQITGDLTGNAENVNGIVTVAHGGTGATTLTGYVKGAGTSALTASATIPGTDITGNIAGNAAGLSTTLAIASGGTGQTTATNAINALVPNQSGNGGKYLSTNGSVVSWQSAPSGGGGGTVTDITAGAGLTGGLITISGTISITDTGVTAASYGAASKTLTATVNSRGQLTSLAETPIAITGAQVSGNIAGNAAGLTATLPIASGGTGATTDAAARTALGATTVGANVFTAVDATAARTAIGAGTGNGNGTVTSITQGTGLSFSATPLTATGTISIDSTVVTLTGTQTLTNKTITFPVISSISNTGTITLPTTTDTLVGRTTTDTLQNKSLSGSQNTFSNIPISALTGGPLSVALGGSGAATFTAGYLKASGTTAFTTVSSIPGADISGNITGNAANVTGTVGYANGGTNATTQAAAQINMLPAQAGNASKFLTTDGTNASWGTSTVPTTYVDTIAALVALVKGTLMNGQTCRVLGYYSANDGGGGDFYWDSTSTTTVDTGTCFQAAAGGTGRWLRVFHDSKEVDVRWFGAKNDGTPCTTIVQAVYDWINATRPFTASTLVFVGGYWNFNLTATNMLIDIIGYGNPQIRPDVTTDPVITVNPTILGLAAPLLITGMHFKQNGTQYTGTGLKLIDTHNIVVANCQFLDFSKSVDRNLGCFTNKFIDNGFEASDYHIYSTDNRGVAHAGAFDVEGGGMRGARLAQLYLDSATGQDGRVTIRNVESQGNTGYFMYIKDMNVSGVGVPAVLIENCWNEGNGTATGITVGGVTADACWLCANSSTSNNRPIIIVRNMPIGAVRLNNTTLTTENCDLTYTNNSGGSTVDSGSVVLHDKSRWINDVNSLPFPGTIRSVLNVEEGGFGAGSWAKMSPLYFVVPAVGGTTWLRADGSTNLSFSGVNTTTQTDSAIPSLTSCQDLSMTGAVTKDGPNSGGTTIAAGKFIVWVMIAKLVSGTAPTCRLGTTGGIASIFTPISSSNFTVHKGLVVSPIGGVNFLAFRFVSTATCVVRIAGYAVLTFDTRQEAIDFLNSPVFPS